MGWRNRLGKVLGPSWFVTDKITMPDGTVVEVDNRVNYTWLLMKDFAQQRLRYGVQARMIGLAPTDALTYIGRALDTPQGPSESTDAYRARLTTAIDDKRLAGTAWPLLRQIRGYCSPHLVRVRLVNEHGHWYTLDRDGTQSTHRYSAWNWDSGRANALQLKTLRHRANAPAVFSPAIPWSKFWVVIYPTTGAPTEPWQRDGTWGDGQTWGDNGETWGSTATLDDVFAIRRIVRRWKPIGSRCVSIIVCFDDTDFDPASAAPPLPDGTWTYAGKYDPSTPGRCVPARSSNALYWEGTTQGAPL